MPIRAHRRDCGDRSTRYSGVADSHQVQQLMLKTSRFFKDKVDAVRRQTRLIRSFQLFRPDVRLKTAALGSADIVASINHLPNKQSYCNVLPVPVLKQVSAEVASFLAALFNLWLLSGTFSDRFKAAYITQLLKKTGLDSTDV